MLKKSITYHWIVYLTTVLIHYQNTAQPDVTNYGNQIIAEITIQYAQ